MAKRTIRQSTLAKMSNEKLRSAGYIRIPAFTRKDGTKVKTHIRELKPSEKQKSSDEDSGWMGSLSAFGEKISEKFDTVVDGFTRANRIRPTQEDTTVDDVVDAFGRIKKINEDTANIFKAPQELKTLFPFAAEDYDSLKNQSEAAHQEVKVSKKKFSMDDHLAKYSNPKSRLDAARREIKNSTHDENSKEAFIESWKESFDTKQSPAAERIALRKEAAKKGAKLTPGDLKAIQNKTMTLSQAIRRRKQLRK